MTLVYFIPQKNFIHVTPIKIFVHKNKITVSFVGIQSAVNKLLWKEVIT